MSKDYDPKEVAIQNLKQVARFLCQQGYPLKNATLVIQEQYEQVNGRIINAHE